MPPAEQPRRSGLAAFGALSLAAPVWGSRFLFPDRFDRVAAELLADPRGAGVQPSHAFWFFGARLQIWVDPAGLEMRLSDFVRDARGARHIGVSFLDGADWSGALSTVKRSPIHREMLQIIAADLDYRETPAYQGLHRAAAEARPVTRNGLVLGRPEEVEAYFRYCRDLIVSIRERGVLPRRQFRGQGWATAVRQGRLLSFEGSERDIGVAIGSNGEMIRHLGGKHRTAVAQGLRLPSIPVEVRLVHVAWLARLMERTGLPAHRALLVGLEQLNREPTHPARSSRQGDKAGRGSG